MRSSTPSELTNHRASVSCLLAVLAIALAVGFDPGPIRQPATCKRFRRRDGRRRGAARRQSRPIRSPAKKFPFTTTASSNRFATSLPILRRRASFCWSTTRLSIRADVEKLEQAAREFAYEIFEGDKLLIVGYDEQAEIVSDWTDDAKSIESSLKLFRKKGQPHLFDAIRAVIEQALRPMPGQKRIIVVISDGLDRGSKTTFEQTLAELQAENIMVYAVQASRSHARRDSARRAEAEELLSISWWKEPAGRSFRSMNRSGGEGDLRRAAKESLRAFLRSVECAVWPGAQFVGVGKPGNHGESRSRCSSRINLNLIGLSPSNTNKTAQP